MKSKFFQRFIVTVLILAVLMIAAVPTTAFAEENTATDAAVTENIAELTSMEEQTVYSIELDEISAPRYYANTSDYLASQNSAAKALRAGMVDRKAQIPVKIKVDASKISGNADIDKLIYGIFNEAIEHTGVPEEGDSLALVYRSLQPSGEYFIDDETYYLTLKYNLTYYTNTSQEQKLSKKVDELIDSLQLDEDISDYKKICNIYNYITSTVRYDYKNLNDKTYLLKHTAYAAAINETAVCQGYAVLFYRLALEAGLDARVITGISTANNATENHAWNIVKLGSVYYLADPTWDEDQWQYTYFLKNENDFYNHIEEMPDEFWAEYPLASKSYSISESEEKTDGSFKYRYYANKARIVKYTGNEEHVTVPAKVGGYPVYIVDSHTFFNTIEPIPIKSIVLSEGIVRLGSEWLYNTTVESIHYPASLVIKPYDPNQSVFTGLSEAPLRCNNLKTITVAEGSKHLTVKDGILYTKDMSKLLVIPPKLGISKLVVPNGVKMINDAACCENEHPVLEEVVLPNSVTMIGYWAFASCNNLRKINIPKNCDTICQFAFFGSGLTNITSESAEYPVKDNVIYTKGMKQLLYCSAHINETKLIVPKGVEEIIDYGFSNSLYLREVTLPASINYIRDRSFDCCDEYHLDQNGDSVYSPFTLKFTGDAPKFDNAAFNYSYLKVYYPKGNSTWTKAVRKDYGAASIEWIEYVPEDIPEYACDAPKVTIANSSTSGRPYLKWAAVEGAQKYEIWRSLSQTGTFTKLYTTTKTNYTNTGAVPGTTYYYKVCSLDANGRAGLFSETVKRCCDCATPTASLSITASTGKPKLSWNAVDGAVKYEVYRSENKTSGFTRVLTTTKTSYNNTGAIAGKTYYYKVKAICGKSSYGDSDFSTVKSITCDCARPDVSIKLSSSGKPYLKWSAVSGASKYYIYRSTSKDGEYKYMYSTTKTSYTNTSATKGKTYYYKVKAICGRSSYGDSAYSYIDSIKSK